MTVAGARGQGRSQASGRSSSGGPGAGALPQLRDPRELVTFSPLLFAAFF